MDVLAILPVRNDAPYVANCLRHLIREGLSVAVIDNESTDDLQAILARDEFRPHIVDSSRLSFRGSYEIRRVYAAVDEVAARVAPDWVVYVDADEILHSDEEGERLVDAIGVAHASEFNAVNFDEFDFLPLEQDYAPDKVGWQPLLHYYFYAPRPLRQMRARRHDAGFSWAEGGVHRVRDSRLRLSPRSLVHRHYIFRSAEHARTKYPGRRHLPEELALGWCTNREGYEPDAFAFPPPSRLKRLSRPDERALDRSDPWRRHYWEQQPSLLKRVASRLR